MNKHSNGRWSRIKKYGGIAAETTGLIGSLASTGGMAMHKDGTPNLTRTWTDYSKVRLKETPREAK